MGRLKCLGMRGARSLHRRALSAFVLSCIVALLGGVARAQPPAGAAAIQPSRLTAREIVAKLISRNAALNTFQAHVEIRMHTGIPFLNPAFEGTTYFKQPDRHEIVFTKSPSYARGFEKLYADISDPVDWDKRFFYVLGGERSYNGHNDVVLRLVERVRGSLDHEEVLVDPRRWVIDEVGYWYYSGGRITVDETYQNEGGFELLDHEHAIIAMPPFPRVRADAQYSQYQINVAIDDAIFTENETKHIGAGSK
jgi:hypothetical protein